MKTLVLYASKTGVTADCARTLSNMIEGAELYDLNKGHFPKPDGYDLVVIGTPIYVGMVMKSVKKYVKSNLDSLLKRQVALFSCGANDKIIHDVDLVTSLPIAFLQHATFKAYFGCELRPEKMNFLYRAIMKKIVNEQKLNPAINQLAIQEFASQLDHLFV